MRFFCSLVVATALMSLACPLYAQSALNRPSNDLVFCSESLDKPTCEANEASCSGGCDLCGTESCRDDYCRPLWSVSAGEIILHRSTPQPSTIVETYHTTPTSTLLDASDFTFGWSTGTDIGVTRRVDKIDAIDAIDFRYFGVQDWQADTSIVTGGFWRFPNTNSGHYLDSQLDTSYQSQLHSAELNVLRDSSWNRVTWIAGARWIGLDERMDMTVRYLPSGSPAHFYFPTHNSLFGGQIGAAIKLWENGGPLYINCTSKAGLYGNAAANRFEIVDSTGRYRLLSSDQQNQLAFVGDIGLTAVYQLADHIALQGGYQLLWIQGVAIAGDQAVVADSVAHGGIASNGGVFYHGATANVTFTW
jgi:hypothetical protein